MAIQVKPVGVISELWGKRTSTALPEYLANAQGAGNVWLTNSIAATPNFGAAIRAGNIEARHAAGIQRAGAGGYNQGIATKGKDRFAEGSRLGVAKYGSRVTPFLSTIASLTLSPRRPRGDPSNNVRVNEVTSALHAQRLAASAAGI